MNVVLCIPRLKANKQIKLNLSRNYKENYYWFLRYNLYYTTVFKYVLNGFSDAYCRINKDVEKYFSLCIQGGYYNNYKKSKDCFES